MSRLFSSVVNDNGRPADRVARSTKALFTKVQLLEQLVIFRQVMPLEIIEELATARGHLQKPAARVEVFAVCAQVLGQMIDASGQERDLDFGRAGILIVSFVFLDDFWFNDCGGHGFVVMVTTVGNPGELRNTRFARVEFGVSRRYRSNPAECRTSHGEHPQPAGVH